MRQYQQIYPIDFIALKKPAVVAMMVVAVVGWVEVVGECRGKGTAVWTKTSIGCDLAGVPMQKLFTDSFK